MEQIRHNVVSFSSSASFTSDADAIGYTNRVMIQIESPSNHFPDSAVTMFLQGAAITAGVSGSTMTDIFYYDYGCQKAVQVQVTATTESVLELPNAGALLRYRIAFTTAATTNGTIRLIYPTDGY